MAEIISRPYDKEGENTYDRVFVCPKCKATKQLEACKGKSHCPKNPTGYGIWEK